MPAERPRARFLTIATTATLAAGALSLALAAPALASPTALVPTAADAASGALIVTEIAPDNVGVDDYEFFEVHNRGATDLDLAAAGFSFAYTYVDGADRARDVPLTVADPVVVPAGGTVVFWLSYTAGSVDSFAHSIDEFRAHWGADDGTPSYA